TLGVNEFVFLLHLFGDGKHVALVGIVVGIAHGGSNDARGSGGHEAFGKLLWLSCGAAPEEIAFLLGFTPLRILHFGDRLRCLLRARGALLAGAPHGGKIRKLGHVPTYGAYPATPKAAHAARHIGMKGHAGLLAVIADVDTYIELLTHYSRDRRLS